MEQTKKVNVWYFGMKAHVGTDNRGVTHSMTVTDAAAAAIPKLPDLMHGEERELYGDKAYWCEGATGARPFLVVKRLCWFDKVRCRGLGKNSARAYTAFPLTNPYLLRKRLMEAGGDVRPVATETGRLAGCGHREGPRSAPQLPLSGIGDHVGVKTTGCTDLP